MLAKLWFRRPARRILQASSALWTWIQVRSDETQEVNALCQMYFSDITSCVVTVRSRFVTFDVGVALLVVAQPQRGSFSGQQRRRGVQKVVQELVVDLVKGHPDGKVDAVLKVVAATV